MHCLNTASCAETTGFFGVKCIGNFPEAEAREFFDRELSEVKPNKVSGDDWRQIHEASSMVAQLWMTTSFLHGGPARRARTLFLTFEKLPSALEGFCKEWQGKGPLNAGEQSTM
jgi:hypothetical protein